jgi:hypothetical protein
MRLYTACADGCRVLTLNADNEQEAMVALTTLLGTTDGMVVRAASVNECLAWNASALDARREQRTKVAPPEHRSSEASRRCKAKGATRSLARA